MAITKSDGSIILSTKVDTTGINKGMTSIKRDVSKIGGMLVAAFGVSQLINFGKEAINLASDLEEVQNVVDTAFGSMSFKIEEFSKKAIEQFGISELTAKKTASTYMAMGKGMGIAEETASDMAITLTGLTADLASFYNLSQERADVVLKSIYTGETETLKQLGIVMTEVNLEQFALSKGITKSLDAMTQQEKTMLRYNYVLSMTGMAQGDFAKTSNSWANKTRILTERFKEMQTVWGKTFKAVSMLFLPILNSIIDAMTKLGEVVRDVTNYVYKIFTGKDLIIDDTSEAMDALGDSSESASDGVTDFGDSVESASKKTKKSLASIDDVSILYSNAAEASAEASKSIEDSSMIPEIPSDSPIDEINNKTDKIIDSIDKLMDTAATALAAIGLLLLAFGQAGWGIGFIIAGAGTWGVRQYEKGKLNTKKIKKTLSDLSSYLADALLVIGVVLLFFGQVGWGIGFILAGAVSYAVKEDKDAENKKSGEEYAKNIEDTLEKIKKYLETAMLALGVLLIFLGHIALGIGFIATGATSMLTSSDEKPDNVSSKIETFVKDNEERIKSISGWALVIGVLLLCFGMVNIGLGLVALGASGMILVGDTTGQNPMNIIFDFINKQKALIVGVALVMLVIGLILIAGGVFTPITLELLAGGAVLLVTTSQLTGESVEDLIQHFIDENAHIILGTSTALLVIGVILTATGVGIGVGIAMIAAGAVGIFAAFTADSAELEKLIIGPLGDLLVAIGSFLLVIGIILLFVPGTIGYGIALVAAGAFAIATSLNFDWTTMPNLLKSRLQDLMQIISSFALVIGLILLFVPGMEARGVGLIVAGLGGLLVANTVLSYDDTALYDEVNDRLSELETLAENKVDSINSTLSNIGKDVSVSGPSFTTASFTPISSYSVPKLATGAVIPPNREFLAVLGDQKNGTNVEAPLSTIEEAVGRAIDAKGGTGGNTTVVLELDGIELGRTITRLNESETRRTGTSMFTKKVALK